MTLTTLGFISVTFLIMCLWASFIVFSIRTAKATATTKRVVLIKMIKFEVFLPGVPWIVDPEIETDAEKMTMKRQKFYRSINYMTWNVIILSSLSFLIGFLFVGRDSLAFWILSCLSAPIGGFGATYYIFLRYLMKDLDYQNIGASIN